MASNSHNQQGWAVVSTLIAIVIGLIMMSGIFMIVNQALSGNKLGATQQELASSRMAIRSTYSGASNYTGLDNATAVKVKAFPSDMVTGAATIANPYGGAVTVTVNATVSTNFDMVYTLVPEEDCIKLASFAYGDWVSLDINGTAIAQTGGGQIAAASAACAAGTANTLTWVSN